MDNQLIQSLLKLVIAILAFFICLAILIGISLSHKLPILKQLLESNIDRRAKAAIIFDIVMTFVVVGLFTEYHIVNTFVISNVDSFHRELLIITSVIVLIVIYGSFKIVNSALNSSRN